jgi:hypothetical protein
MLLAFNDMNYFDTDNTLELVFLTALILSAFDDVNCHDFDNTFRLVFFIWKLTQQSVFVLLHMRAEIFLEFVNVQASAPKQPSKHWHGCR